MKVRETLRQWVLDAVADSGGSADIITCAKHIWLHHEHDLREAGDSFFDWQYSMRWAADDLRKRGKLAFTLVKGRSVWHLPGRGAH